MLLVVVIASRPAPGSSLAVAYLRQASDRYQNTVDVYTVADAAGNHFAARGEFDNLSAALVSAMDEISSSGPCLGITCITATFDPGRALWGGWYFMNGVLGPTDREPSANWGNSPDAGYDLTGATTLQFRARGMNGGENVLFFCCGVGFDPNTGVQTAPYPDSSQRLALGVQLTTSWLQYTIPLTGVDLHYMLGGFGWVASATGELADSRPITFYLDDIQYLKARPNDSRFLVSYETIKSTNPFDAVERNAAYVYDNSVALIALLAAGDLARAQTIAGALLYAQGHDRFFTDGRVRNAYQGGDISLPPGWLPNNLANTVRMPGWYDAGHTQWFEDETQVSTNTGNVAWAGLALLDMWEVTKDAQYLSGAEALGNWVTLNAAENRDGSAGLLGGFTGGYDGWENGAASGSAATCASGVLVNGQCKRLYKSTEHNIDLYSMFSRLYMADGQARWAAAARQAKHFFLSMWDPQEGKYWTGTTEDGVTVSTDVIPVDIQAWAVQVLGAEAQPYLSALAYVEANHKTSLGYGFKQDGGNSCGDYTWFEGTSQVAVAYFLSGNKPMWQSILNGVHSVQSTAGSMPATDGPCLNTGFTLNDGSPWEYFPRVHVGATGWLALAENGVNPYRSDLYSPGLAPSALAFGDRFVAAHGSSSSITLSNPSVGPLGIRSVAVSGANASDFQPNNTCGSTLPAGGSCSIAVSFTPTAAGTRGATLMIAESSDAAMIPAVLSVSLTGNGVVSPSSYNLKLTTIPAAAGTITATPAPTAGAYAVGTKVCLAPVPAAGWSFSGWSGDALDSSGCTIVDSNKSVTAYFARGPVIQITSVPQYGSVPGTITGTVTGAAPQDYKIATLIFLSGQGWFSKPYCTSTATAFGSDGSFSVLLTTGGVDQFATRIALLVVPSPIAINCYTGVAGIPDELLQQAVAQVIIDRSNPNEREIGFSGQRWAVKASTVPIGPGNCIFSDSPDSVSVDTQGNLHLKILNTNANWSCAEVYSRSAVGYGVYQWTIASAPALDPTGVFGGFTWSDGDSNSRELDVEFGLGQPGDTTNAQFVVQPSSQVGNLRRISIPSSSPITFKMMWLPGSLLFQAFLGVDDQGDKIQEWQYPGTPPVPDSQYENFRFNLWLNGGPPASGQTQEVIVNSYLYQPFVADPTAPELSALVNGASFQLGAAPGMDFALFGSGFSAQPIQASSSPLPLTLGGVSVAVNGIPAPLFYAGPNQINGQIPYVTPLGSSLVSVSVNGKASQTLASGNAAAAPGIFTDVALHCLAQNQDQSLNSPANPAKPGSFVVAYLTGLGQVDNPVSTGAPAPLSPLSRPLLAGLAQVDGQGANLQFLGLAPELVGVGQANVQIPPGASPGLRSLIVSVGGVASNACALYIGDHPLGVAPSISGITPNTGAAAGGTPVAITGANFQNGAAVRFGQAPAASATFIRSTGIQAVTPPGTGVVSVTVTNPDNQAATLVSAFTYEPPLPSSVLAVRPSSISFSYTSGAGSPPSYFLSVTSTPTTHVAFTMSLGSSGCSWLDFTTGSGLTPAMTIPAGLNTAIADGLTQGTYNCAITVSAPGVSNSPVTIPVTLTVAPLSLSVNPSSVTFNYPIPTPPLGVPPISVGSSAGSVAVTQSLGAGCGWLTLSPTGGNTPISFSPSVNTTVAATLTTGNHPCTVTFTATGRTATTTLLATLIVAPPSTLAVSPSSMTFSYTPHAGTPPGYFLSVTSSPSNGVAFTTSLGSSGCSWLNFTPGSGVTPATSIPASLNTAVADGLPPGTYNCTLTITSPGASNSPVTIPVVLTASALSLSVSPTSWTFNYPPPVPLPGVPPFSVYSSAGTVTVIPSLGSGCNWITLSAPNWNTPVSLSPTVNTVVAATLKSGSYPCTVTFTAVGTTANATLSLTLVVASPTVSNPSIQAVVQGCRVHGTVAGVNPPQSFEVVVYALTNAYYIQPCITEPITPIAPDGTWGPVDSHNGAIYAILIQAGYSPPVLTGSLPAVDGVNVLAVTGPVGAIAGCDVARCPAR
jgi:uncharacterized protein (TIGR03437 family)